MRGLVLSASLADLDGLDITYSYSPSTTICTEYLTRFRGTLRAAQISARLDAAFTSGSACRGIIGFTSHIATRLSRCLHRVSFHHNNMKPSQLTIDRTGSYQSNFHGHRSTSAYQFAPPYLQQRVSPRPPHVQILSRSPKPPQVDSYSETQDGGVNLDTYFETVQSLDPDNNFPVRRLSSAMQSNRHFEDDFTESYIHGKC